VVNLYGQSFLRRNSMAPRIIAPKRLKDGTYEICFYTNGRGSSRIRRKFSLRKDADLWIKSYFDKVEGRESNPSILQLQTMNFASEYQVWKMSNQLSFSSSYKIRTEGIAKRIVLFFGPKPIHSYRISDVIDFQNFLKVEGLSNCTINRNTEVLKSVINHSVRLGRIASNPVAAARKLPPIKRKETDYWSDEEASSFLSYAKTRYESTPKRRWIYTAYLVAINTGLRAGELWGLKVSDLRADRIIVTRQFERTMREFAPLKCKRTSTLQSKIVPLHNSVRLELDEHIQRNKLKPTDMLFTNSKGEGVWHDSFSDMYNRDLERWGGKGVRFHDLRTTYLTQLVSQGYDLRTVMEVAGHADIKTTMGYVKLVGQNIDKLAQSFSISPTSSGNTDVTLPDS
jgi:integrase